MDPLKMPSSESLTCDPVGIAGVASLMMASVAWPAAQEVLAITFRNRAINRPCAHRRRSERFSGEAA